MFIPAVLAHVHTDEEYKTDVHFEAVCLRLLIKGLIVLIRGGVLENFLGLENVLEHILKSLALTSKVKSLALDLASKPQVLENCPVFGSRTALFLEPLKFCWKTPETSRKTCEHLFCFPQLEHSRSREGGTRKPAPSPNRNFSNDRNVPKEHTLSSVSVSF